MHYPRYPDEQITILRGHNVHEVSLQYIRNNEVSEWRNNFTKHKGNIPSAAYSDAKWRSASLALTLAGESGKRGRAQFHGCRPVGDQRVLMEYAQISPCSIVLPHKKL